MPKTSSGRSRQPILPRVGRTDLSSHGWSVHTHTHRHTRGTTASGHTVTRRWTCSLWTCSLWTCCTKPVLDSCIPFVSPIPPNHHHAVVCDCVFHRRRGVGRVGVVRPDSPLSCGRISRTGSLTYTRQVMAATGSPHIPLYVNCPQDMADHCHTFSTDTPCGSQSEMTDL